MRFSVIIPAHNEARVISRCLTSLLAGTGPEELEIIVVCNGCADNTATLARDFGARIQVVETDIASKTHALNLGDKLATAFPRFYVDADVEVSAAALGRVASVLQDDSPCLVAAPQGVVEWENRRLLVRSFYRIWTSLPYFTEGTVGVGVYGFSRRGRERFGMFPDIIADDGFARLCAAPHERVTVSDATFRIVPPTNLRSLLRIQTRMIAGNVQLRRRFPELMKNNTTSGFRSLRIIAGSPGMWLHAPVYIGLMALARLRAEYKLRLGNHSAWERDDTSRNASSGMN